ncbi:helix-turn-helix domain-containing protein [Bacteroides caccae]|jgi:transcriptional regulator with XRE-family HTH domain|uniref:Helix-turn-helix domain-containing protein n=1 Tax=Bacteroides caccae TaxID=47678 RepID=A0AA94Y7T3_9BACE|nr:helix-turn-helix domain-containing protein [Bacteroides caccae]DAO28277.1 MAG TPA: SOS-response transcriptional repressor [Caudoviricetes sp.]
MDIKTVIKARGYTIERIANEWESKNGKPITKGALSQSINKNPTVETLQRIANVIGCNVGDFFADELENIIICPNCGTKLKITKEDD